MSKKNNKNWDVIIIGGGASGLMTAVIAARADQNVLILEQKNDIGKKILATGNGKCNYTNQFMENSCFYGNKELIEGILAKFDRDDCLKFFHELGIYPKERKGYYYPNSETAVSVVEAFRQELIRLGVTIKTESPVQEILPKYVGFEVRTAAETFSCKKLVLSTGLLASPKLGSDGSLMGEIKELGHGFTPIVPALCGFYASGLNFKKVSGVRTTAAVTLEVDGLLEGQDIGEVQLTDYGISGIPVFQISRLAGMALYHKKKPVVHLNFLPDMTEEDLMKELHFRLEYRQSTGVLGEIFNGLLHQKLVDVLFEAEKLDKNMPVSRISEEQLHNICCFIQDCPVTITKSRGFEFAQVCAGGVRTEDIDTETLESKLVKNLYFTGELLDVDGICGGYNLQWAWSSGYVAGTSVSKSK